ncbi:hypothetical protein O5O45_08395 [Hahella aquimaris]|uniref:hypothetical protein n=1 Tax=Hahella sp. HNIBRBA332 TaxID=3015983 RepID=UPI00273B4A7B|nr:hypothetical protein [Hahella sp. HNIBRBA332]WLQ15933.1 hypothetical protein O5O45_08395 [Hahella sp. HNIBRBA332]
MLEKLDPRTLDALLHKVGDYAQDMMADLGDEIRDIVANADGDGSLELHECIGNCWEIHVGDEIKRWMNKAMQVKPGEAKTLYLKQLHELAQERFTKSCYEALGMMHLYY